MPKEKSAGAVVFYKSSDTVEYLLLHYEVGHWGFPKGHIEQGEREQETLEREVREETGIENIEIIPGFKEFISYTFRRRKNEMVFKTVTYYLARVKVKEVRLSFEHIDYKWLKYKEAIKLLTFMNTKDVLVEANTFITQNRN